MAERPPTVYLLYGDHEIAISEFISRMREKMGDPSSADMNTDIFPSGKLDLGKIEQVCASLPFLSRRRLVIIEEPLKALTNDDLKGKFYRILESIPETTALLLIERVDFLATRGKTTKPLSALILWLEETLGSAYIKRVEVPRGSHFVQWIRQHAHELEGEIEPQAAHLLSELVAGDPNLAHHELSKLLNFVNRDRPIEVEDVEDLTPLKRQSDVFAMVDAMGQRNGPQALQWLRQLLENDSPMYAFSMIIRQFRLLLLAKEAQVNQKDPEKALNVHPYVAGKIIAQARNFSLPDLEQIYHLLNNIDLASKTGKDNLEIALEGFVANLTS
jgi:DNA polymerase-3 subunit delta